MYAIGSGKGGERGLISEPALHRIYLQATENMTINTLAAPT